jgi:hypothetical protein
MMRIPHCLDNWLIDGGKVVSLTCWPSFTTRNIFWYSFLIEAGRIKFDNLIRT